jgi:hypothetical protein
MLEKNGRKKPGNAGIPPRAGMDSLPLEKGRLRGIYLEA